MIKKIILLTIALLCAVAQGAWAKSVTFHVRSWDDNNKQVVTTTDTMDCTVLAGNPDEWMQLGDNDEADHYYVVTGNVSYKTLNVFGKVHLILADGATLTLTGGLKVEKNNNAHLFIYSQSDGDSQGKLIVTNSYKRAAGIGSGEGWDCGEITIHGGKLDVTGGQYAAGIGAGGSYVNTTNTEGRSTNGGTTIVYGGEVKVQGGDSGAGIGGGAGYISPNSWTSNGGYFYLYGGTVTATGGEYAAGIGGGGGKRSVLSNRYGSGGKSSKVYVYGGNLTAQGGHRGAGIGGGNNGNGWSGGWDKDFELYVYNGTVNATGGDYGAGIGGGCNCNGGKVYIYDGNVTAKGGEDAAGIGGGEDGLGGELHVSGGTVRAEGKGCGAGIGGGEYTNHQGSSTQGTGANTYITGGTVIAIAGGDCNARNAKGGSAIGTGQGVKNKDDSDKAKVLEIPDNYMVTGGDAENNIERVFTNGERIDACRWRNYVKIEECSHTKPSKGSDQTDAVTYTIDNDTHTMHCRYCAYSPQESHTFVENVCSYCGKTDNTSNDMWSVTLHRASAATSTKYADRVVMFVVKGQSFTLPAVSATNGLTLMGYTTSWTENNGIEMKDDETLTAVGAVVTPEADMNYYPRYRYRYVPTWTWNDADATATLSIKCSALSSESINVSDITYTTSGDVKTATGTYEHNGSTYTFTDTYLLPVGDLVLYDDASNEDNLDTYHGREVNTLTLQGRTLYKDGMWNTLCLPFDVVDGDPDDGLTFTGTPLEGATVVTIANATIQSKQLHLDYTAPQQTMDAGKPYLVKWETPGDNIVNPVFTGVTIKDDLSHVNAGAVRFMGIFAPEVLPAGSKDILYVGADGKLYYPSVDLTLGAFRGYFEVMLGGEDDPSGIIGINGNGAAVGDYYDLQGRKVQQPMKGLYIVNGKKVFVK